MKGIKKVFAVFLAITMFGMGYPLLSPTTVEARLKYYGEKKITLAIGEMDTVYTEGKGITYRSSNKKIATVNKKGSVIAKKVGNCKIVIKQGKSKIKVNVKVIPENVTLKKVCVVGADSTTDLKKKANIKVEWKKAKGAAGYYIYYSTKKNSGYKKATVKGGKKKAVVLSNLTYGNTYYIKVKAFGNKKKNISEEASKIMSAKTWALKWSDEFNGTSLDQTKWKYNFKTGMNQEMETLTDGNNIKFENGNLVIVPRMEVPKNGGKTNYSSAKIDSEGKAQFTYGKIEIRAKATKGKGTWSAGWTLGVEGKQKGWPDTGEIDILESMMGRVPQTIHCRFFNNQKESHGNKTFWTPLTQKQSAEQYHTYAAVWTTSYIEFYCDGKRTGKYDSTVFQKKHYNEVWGDAFTRPHYFILNCAIGGNAAGEVSTEGWKKVSETDQKTVYEDYYYVDYVRVYK